MSPKVVTITRADIIRVLKAAREEIVLSGRWSSGSWVEGSLLTKGTHDEKIAHDEKTACGWRFCLGGALAWEALADMAIEDRLRHLRNAGGGAYPAGLAWTLRTNPLAMAALDELLIDLARTKWYRANGASIIESGPKYSSDPYEDKVDCLIEFNDSSEVRGPILRLLGTTIKRLEAAGDAG